MTIRELMVESIKHQHRSLLLLIDFLVCEKEVMTLDDDASALNLYLLPKHEKKMNRLLLEYYHAMGNDWLETK